VDYNETFAPVAKFTSFRCILALVALEDMEIDQMDMKTAFLNGKFKKKIYMEQLQGFMHQGGEHLVCKLHKSLYGLKQSPRAWNQKLDAFLKNIEFMKSEADPSVYVAQVGDVKFFIVVYVDDLILVCNDENKLLQIKEELNQKFEMKDLGELHFFLGMEVERNCDERLLHINQIKYLKEILKRFRMEECQPIGVPFDPKMKLQKNANGNDESKGFPYQQAVGSLMYDMLCTRPNLAYPISVLSHHMVNPNMEHWMAIERIFQYLQSTLQMKLQFDATPSKELLGYCDADWGGDFEYKRSTIGFVFMIGGGAISWSSKRQPTIALSTTEAKYMLNTQATKEAIWITKLMMDLRYIEENKVMVIRCNNQGAISLTKNLTHHAQTKHIDVQHHFVQKRVENGEV
jgi:hypothetical protein